MTSTSGELNISDKSFEKSWIIDSRSTDHMTNNFKYFYTYVPYPSNKKIVTIYGSFNIIAGKSNIKFSPTIVVKNVLLVPKLCISFVLVNKLSQDLNCKVIVGSFHYDFQDQNSRKIIGRVEIKNGLYYFNSLRNSSLLLLVTLYTSFAFTIKDLDTH